MSNILGVDLSNHNGSLDFSKLKAAGIKFIIARASYRTSEDERFQEYVKQARKAGITVLGGYHFLYLNNGGTYANNAKRFVDSMRSAGLADAYYCIDVEYNLWEQLGTEVTTQTVNAYTKGFIAELLKQGVKKSQIIIYTNLDFYRRYDDEIKNNYAIWLAELDGDPSYPCVIQQYSWEFRVDGCSCDFDANHLFDETMLTNVSNGTINKETEDKNMGYDRNKVLDIARGWMGCNEDDGSFVQILNIYNNYKPWNHANKWGAVARNYAIQTCDEWCATFASACFIRAGMPEICPLEVSCLCMIANARKMGCWIEDEYQTPEPGWLILYTWDGDQSDADHVGIIEAVNGSSITVIEGNKDEEVARRTINVGNGLIRGYVAIPYGQGYAPTPVQPAKSGHDVAWDGYICKQTTPKLQPEAGAGNMTTVQSADINDAVGVCYEDNGYYLVKFDKTGTYGYVPVSCVSKDKTETKPDTKQDAVDINDLAKRVINGEFGNGDARRAALDKYGAGTYDKVQARVNEMLQVTTSTPVYHTVVSGDTLSKIAMLYGVTVNSIVRLNNIANPDLIYVGQTFRIK